MSRDYRKLRVFVLADRLVLETNFLNIASGSAVEAYYLAHVAGRLQLVEERESAVLEKGYSELAASLRAMSQTLRVKAGT